MAHNDMSKIPVTLKGAELLRDELHQLKTVGRPNVIAAIAEARSYGDLSENAEYDAAKERQAFIEGRIQEIEGKLSNAQIIDPKLLDADDSSFLFGQRLLPGHYEAGMVGRIRVVPKVGAKDKS